MDRDRDSDTQTGTGTGTGTAIRRQGQGQRQRYAGRYLKKSHPPPSHPPTPQWNLRSRRMLFSPPGKTSRLFLARRRPWLPLLKSTLSLSTLSLPRLYTTRKTTTTTTTTAFTGIRPLLATFTKSRPPLTASFLRFSTGRVCRPVRARSRLVTERRSFSLSVCVSLCVSPSRCGACIIVVSCLSHSHPSLHPPPTPAASAPRHVHLRPSVHQRPAAALAPTPHRSRTRERLVAVQFAHAENGSSGMRDRSIDRWIDCWLYSLTSLRATHSLTH